MKNYYYRKCSNCGKKGHFHKECPEPKISIGMVCCKVEPNSLKFLLIRRKWTYHYTDLIRGNYLLKPDHVIKMIKGITESERQHILKIGDITKLWNDVWANQNKSERFNRDYNRAITKFNLLYNIGVPQENNEAHLTLTQLFDKYPPDYAIPPWEFPKGKRDINETNLKCACREFREETNLISNDYSILFDLSPITEEFIGNNKINYKYIYYVAVCHKPIEVYIDPENPCQSHEIGDIGWYDYTETKYKLRRLSADYVDDFFDKIYEKLHRRFIGLI